MEAARLLVYSTLRRISSQVVSGHWRSEDNPSDIPTLWMYMARNMDILAFGKVAAWNDGALFLPASGRSRSFFSNKY